MALFVKQDEERSRIQTKVAAELAERINKKPLQEKKADPAFFDGTKKTTGLAWAWSAIAVICVVVFVLFVMFSQYKY